MLATLIIIWLSLVWLGYETDWMRVRLPSGVAIKPKYARYVAYNKLRGTQTWRDTTIHSGGNLPADYSPNGEPEYTIILSPGIKDILCGWRWLDEHCADMVDYQPQVFMTVGNIRYTMTIKQPSIIKDIMRVNRLTKKQKLALSGY